MIRKTAITGTAALILAIGVFVPIANSMAQPLNCCGTAGMCCCTMNTDDLSESRCQCRVRELPEYPNLPEGVNSDQDSRSILSVDLIAEDFEIADASSSFSDSCISPIVQNSNSPPLFLLNSSFII